MSASTVCMLATFAAIGLAAFTYLVFMMEVAFADDEEDTQLK